MSGAEFSGRGPECPRQGHFWIEFLRLPVMLGVVGIHVSADVITEWGKVPAAWWWSAHLYDSLIRGCVPLFVMISGALLLSKQEGLADFFLKRCRRILLPFLFWTAVFLIWKKLHKAPDMTLFDALRDAAGDRVYYHLWFLYVIAGLYLAAPILRVFVRHASASELTLFLSLWFLLSSIVPAVSKVLQSLTGEPLRWALSVPFAQGYIGYFLLGYCLTRFFNSAWIKPACLLWLASLVLCIAGEGWLSLQAGRFTGFFYDNFSPNVVIYTASFFVIAQGWGDRLKGLLGTKLRSVISSASGASFGIYLMHPLWIDFYNSGWGGFVLNGKSHHPLWMIPLTVAAIYLPSWGCSALLQKLPVLRKVV